MSVKRDGQVIFPTWRYRPIYITTQAGTVSGTWYTIVPPTSDVNIGAITTVNSANFNVEVRATIDGNVVSGIFPHNATIVYYWYLADAADALVATTIITKFGSGTEAYARTLTVEMRELVNGATLTGTARLYTQ